MSVSFVFMLRCGRRTAVFFICAQKSAHRQLLDIHKIENLCGLLYLKVNIMDVGYEDVNWK